MHDEIIEIWSDSRNMIVSDKSNAAPIPENGAADASGVMLEHDDYILSLTEKGCQISVIAEYIRLITIAARQQMSVGEAAGMWKKCFGCFR